MKLKILKSITSYKQVLPAFMTIVTGKSRYLPDIEWSSESWTHNIFRVYEMLFWRQVGVRVESSLYSDTDGNNVYQFYTVEALLAHTEYQLRNIFRLPKFKFVPVSELQYATPLGSFPTPRPIFNFAIAYDNAVLDSSGSTNITTHTTANFTVTGSNITLTTCGYGQAGSATYPSNFKWGGSGGTAMTTASANIWVTGAALSVSQWYLDDVAAATQTVYVLYGTSQSRIGVGVLSLTGCASGSLGAVNTNSSTTYGSGSTVAVTTTTANSFVLSRCSANDTATASATGTNQTLRYDGNILGDHRAMGSSQTTTTAGSYTSSYTWTSGVGGWVISAMEVKAGVSPITNIADARVFFM